MIRQRTKIFSFFLFLGDSGATVLAFILAYFLRGIFPRITYADLFPFSWYGQLLLIIVPVWGFIFFFMRLYEFWRGPGFWKECRRIIQALLISFFIFGFIIFLGKFTFVSRVFLFFFFIFNVVLIPIMRILIRRSILAFNRKNGKDRIYTIVGVGNNARNMARKIEKHGDLGLKILGFLVPNGESASGSLDGYPILGGPKDLVALLEEKIIDEVIFAVSQEELRKVEDLFLLCEERGITARVILDFFPHNIARTYLEELDGVSLLTFSTTPKNELMLLFRRILNFTASAVLISAFMPLILLIVLLIRLDSRGPVIYRQIRCGLNGRQFWFYKFRSMVEDAERLKVDLFAHNVMGGPAFKMNNDPRVTRVGRFLRKTSLDELPQLYNVLRGDMSLVGPRPPLPEEVAQYKGWQRRRLSMTPGITGLWQVSGRNLLNFDEWMKLDLDYIDNWSLWLDIKILFKTVPTILLGKGAM